MGSHDKSDSSCGVPSIDDGSAKSALLSQAAVLDRNIIIMEVKGNLLKEEREKMMKTIHLPHHRKIAKVLMGEPDDDFKKYAHKVILAEKQKKVNDDWQKGQEMKRRRKLLEEAKRKAEQAKKEAEKAASKS